MMQRIALICLFAGLAAACSGSDSLSSSELASVDRYVGSAGLFDAGVRRCAAGRVVRSAGVAAVDAAAASAGVVAESSETRRWFVAFERCVELEATLLAAVAAPAAPDAAQLRCLSDAKPLRDDVEAVVSARLAGREAPTLSAVTQSRLADAYAKCLRFDQVKLLGQ